MASAVGSAHLVPDSVMWATPDATTWIGSRGEDLMGIVEFSDGHFIASDSSGASRSFGSLNDAKRAIEDPARTLRTELPAYGGPRSRWDTIFATARQRRTATYRRTAA